MCECAHNKEQPYNCTKYSTKGHSTNKKRQQIGLQITVTEQPQKADQSQREVWRLNATKPTKNFPLHTPARSVYLSNTLTQITQMEALLPVPWILSRTSRTFQRPRRGWDRLGQFGTGFQRLPGQGARTDLHPEGRRSLRAIVVTSDCALSSCWSLRHTGKPPRLFLGLFVFYAPDELCRWDAFGFLEFHCSQQTLQSSPGTEATQVLTLDPSHAPSVIFLGDFSQFGMSWWPNAKSVPERRPSAWRASAELWLNSEARLGRDFDVDQ